MQKDGKFNIVGPFSINMYDLLRNQKDNQLLIPALVVLLAAVIVSMALVVTRPINTNTLSSGIGAPDVQGTIPEGLVPATANTPAHIATPEGEKNPSEDIPHYPSYRPQSFTVTAVSGNVVTGTIDGKEYSFTVTNSTDIYKLGGKKDAAAYQREMAEFNEKMRYANTNDVYIAPEAYVRERLSLSDIKPNVSVLLSSSDDTNADVIFIPR